MSIYVTLDNMWLMWRCQESQFFSITKVTAQDAPTRHLLINYAKYVCVAIFYPSIIWVASQNTHSIGYIHVFTYWQQVRTGSKYVKIFHKAILLLQMNLSGNYSKYFNYWVRMDPFEMLLILWETGWILEYLGL